MTGVGGELLRFEAVCLPVAVEGLGWIEIDALLAPGGLWLVDVEGPAQEQAFVDGALGLAMPLDGRIRCRGHDWATLPASFRDALRGRVGLVPNRGLFLTYADVGANVLLPTRFHRRDPDPAIFAAAGRLAARFGLPGLPSGAPPAEGSVDALLVACVRAFLGEPLLVIVESQRQPWRDEVARVLIDAVQEVRERGGAAIWCLRDDPLFEEAAVPATARLRMRGRTVEPIAP